MKLVLLGTILSGISFTVDTEKKNNEEILEMMKTALLTFCEQHNMWSLRVICKSMILSVYETTKDTIYISGM